MPADLADRLRRQRAAIAEAAVGRLTDTPTASLEADAARIAAIDKLLAALPARSHSPLLIAVGSALVCALIVWLAWTLRVDAIGLRTWVVVEVTAERIDLELKDRWVLLEPATLAGDRLHIAQAALAFHDRNILFGELPAGSAVRIAAGLTRQPLTLTLVELDMAAQGRLQIERMDGARVRLQLAGAANGAVQIGGDARVDWSDDSGTRVVEATRFAPFDETLSFRSTPAARMPLVLDLAPPRRGQFALQHLTVSAVRFGREVPLRPGERTVLSTIRSGTLRLPELDQITPLDPGVGLQLEGLDGYVREVVVTARDGLVKIALHGEVDRVNLLSPGSGGQLDQGLTRALTPSLLTYGYHSQSLALVLAAVSFVWGALFYLRGLLGGSR
jgi:hypothetical protein